MHGEEIKCEVYGAVSGLEYGCALDIMRKQVAIANRRGHRVHSVVCGQRFFSDVMAQCVREEIKLSLKLSMNPDMEDYGIAVVTDDGAFFWGKVRNTSPVFTAKINLNEGAGHE